MSNFKDDLKDTLTIEQIYSLVAELGGDPRWQGENFISRTICHGGDSHKLYYYAGTKLFHCYTQCSDSSFDIFQLIMKVKRWPLPKAINYVASYFGIGNQSQDFPESQDLLEDWKIFNNYNRINSLENKQTVDLRVYPEDTIKYLPSPKISPWEQEHITPEVIAARRIKYDPVYQGIVIPHYDINGNLIGVRERTLVKEEESAGKYKPAILNNQMYNHPLGFNLYNLNNSKENIKILKKAIVYESEKSTLLHASYFGLDNDISVACCGSNFITYQAKLLLSLGVNEIIIAFDRQYQEIGDREYQLWTKKLIDIHNKYSKYCTISFMFDKERRLQYKASPIDQGPELFLQLFEERIFL